MAIVDFKGMYTFSNKTFSVRTRPTAAFDSVKHFDNHFSSKYCGSKKDIRCYP